VVLGSAPSGCPTRSLKPAYPAESCPLRADIQGAANARASTLEQNVTIQEDALRHAGFETAAPMILQVAPTMTAGTRPHNFAVPLQLFADHNLL
jgi:hypothetical protein